MAVADRPATQASPVGTTETDEDDEIDFAALAEDVVNETIADMADDDEPWTEQERADMIAEVHRNLENAASGE